MLQSILIWSGVAVTAFFLFFAFWFAQAYLVDLKKVEAARDIGVEQAKALENADIKINALSSGPTEGLTGVMDLFTAKGGVNIGMAMEAFKNVSGISFPGTPTSQN